MAGDQSLRNRVAIVGVGESDIGKVPGMSGLGLNAQAARRALDDAGLKVSDIDGVLTAYSFTEPYFMLGTVLCEYLGLRPRYNASLVVGGATPAVMLKHAAEAIAAGSADTILVCAGENRATGQSRDQAVAALMAVGHPYFERPYGPSIPGFYAMISRRHMEEFGTTEQQMAAVAVTARHHASMHPNAHMRKPITVDDVMASKPIADPLKMLDCCLLSDAGGAFIVTSAERARDLKSRPAYLAGIAEYHTHEHIMCAPSLTEFGARQTGEAAYRMAGLGPEDVDVAQLYDCFSITVLLQLEDYGFCKRGEGGDFVASGAIRWPDGRLPVNTHGGNLSEIYLLGLTHVIEAVRQLRGESTSQVRDAEIALVTAGPSNLPSSSMLLRR